MTLKIKPNLRAIAQLAFLSLLAGCGWNSSNDPIVAKRYIHRYGVDVPADEWVEQGESGQVVEALQNGVTVTRSYRNGVLEGTASYTFPHRNTIERSEDYLNGQLQKRQRFYPSGTLLEEETFEAEDKSARSYFYENSVLRARERYDAGRLTQGTYYTLGQGVDSQVINGQGKRVQRDSFGQLLYIDSIEDGYLHTRTYYHPNGMPRACVPYSQDKIHGQLRTYMPGGDPQSVEQWENGQQHGHSTYYIDGAFVGEVHYDRGKRVGLEKRYAPEDNRVIEETMWVNGQKHGPSYTYVQGQKVETWYFRGEEVSKAMYDQLSFSALR